MPQPAIYRDLDAWKQSMDLVERIYKASAEFPRGELYGLCSQLRRAAVSIPSNVAEGFCRRTTKAYAYHVSIALGSHGELETIVELAARLGFLLESDRQTLQTTSESVGRLLSGLYRSLEDKIRRDDARTAASP